MRFNLDRDRSVVVLTVPGEKKQIFCCRHKYLNSMQEQKENQSESIRSVVIDTNTRTNTHTHTQSFTQTITGTLTQPPTHLHAGIDAGTPIRIRLVCARTHARIHT